MLFRSTRGNCYIRFAPIEQDISDPETGGNVHKHVFIIFFKSAAIERKVRKICDAFSAHRYSVPSMEDPGAVQAMLDRNAGELSDSHTVLSKNQDTRFRMCQMLAACVEEVRRESACAGRTMGVGWRNAQRTHPRGEGDVQYQLAHY